MVNPHWLQNEYWLDYTDVTAFHMDYKLIDKIEKMVRVNAIHCIFLENNHRVFTEKARQDVSILGTGYTKCLGD